LSPSEIKNARKKWTRTTIPEHLRIIWSNDPQVIHEGLFATDSTLHGIATKILEYHIEDFFDIANF